MILRIGIGFALAVAPVWSAVFAQQAPNQAAAAAIDKAVSDCVDVVHHAGSAEGYDMQQFYVRFDAFYNSATGTIQNNANRVGDFKAQFVFNNAWLNKVSL